MLGGGSASQRSHLLKFFFACSKPTCLALGSPKTNFVFLSTFHTNFRNYAIMSIYLMLVILSKLSPSMKFSFFSIRQKFNYDNVNFGVDPPPLLEKVQIFFLKASLRQT